ncbi:MAG TPA: ATP-dependent RNA helicase [Cytophagales bacterium]|nr:ATP-dependent RNA helicase [Cytophagales bacterium]
MKFNEFGFSQNLLEGIEAIGFEDATSIQEKAIPHIMEGNDLIGSAQTGTGKTAAFLLPIIDGIIKKNVHDDQIKALIIVPTRELAMQIDQQMEGLSYFTSVSSIPVYGGSDGNTFSKEKKALESGADVVVGTPGRLIAHLNMGYVKLKKLEYFILDEADRMLDMGFHADIMKIIGFLPEKRQNLLFSATMPKKILELSKSVLHDPVEVHMAISKPVEKLSQRAFIVYESQKIPLAKFLLSAKRLKSVIVFCSTKSSAKELTKSLKKENLPAEEIHSDLGQETREEVLSSFKHKQLKILVATDILSRGIDVEDIDLVLNYDVPNSGEDYIHRIGRTARAAAYGIAITLVSEKEQGKMADIERLLGAPVPKAEIPGTFGPSPEYKPRTRGNGRGKRRKPNFKRKNSR